MEIRLNYLEKLARKANTPSFSFKQVEMHNEILAVKNSIIKFIQYDYPNKERKKIFSCCINQLVSFIDQIICSNSGNTGTLSSSQLTLISELRNLILYIESVATKWFNYSIYIPSIMQQELKDALSGVENDIKPSMTKLKNLLKTYMHCP